MLKNLQEILQYHMIINFLFFNPFVCLSRKRPQNWPIGHHQEYSIMPHQQKEVAWFNWWTPVHDTMQRKSPYDKLHCLIIHLPLYVLWLGTPFLTKQLLSWNPYPYSGLNHILQGFYIKLSNSLTFPSPMQG